MESSDKVLASREVLFDQQIYLLTFSWRVEFVPKATHLWVNEMKGCSWHGSLSSIDIMYSPAALLYELLNPMHGVCVPLFSSQLVGRDLQNFDEVQKSRFDF